MESSSFSKRTGSISTLTLRTSPFRVAGEWRGLKLVMCKQLTDCRLQTKPKSRLFIKKGERSLMRKCLCIIPLNGNSHFGLFILQFSIFKPRIRSMWLMLSVTSTIFCCRAVAPIAISKFSILRPIEVRNAFSRPNS